MCQDGERKEAEREEEAGRGRGKQNGEEGVGEKVKEKDGSAFEKGESEKTRQNEDVECCPGLEGEAGGGGE